MEVKITTLSEDTANYAFLAEWGLSILIEKVKFVVYLQNGTPRYNIQEA
jgi:metal-dependent hydrolase (beta-lactamase superfamily II)